MSAPAPHIQSLFRHAQRLSRTGRRGKALATYQHILALDPGHAGALGFLGLDAFQHGELALSERYIRAALDAHPDDALLRQNLGLIFEAQGRLPEALQALDGTLEGDPQLPLAHLHRAGVLVKLNRLPEAADAFTRALALNPRLKDKGVLQQAPENIQGLIRQSAEVRETLLRRERAAALGGLERTYGAQALRRARHFVAIFNGEEERRWADPRQRPNWHFFPGLEPMPWYDAATFSWVADLEAAYPAVREELTAILQERSGLAPYVTSKQRMPEDWRRLADSTDWSAYHLLKGGKRIEDHCTRCPHTMEVLTRLPLMDCPGHAPEAFFSILKPGTRIPPHVGLANTKLAVHLSLVIPPHCAITVGGETRTWEAGRVLVFDDSFEHQAENLSDQTRVVLITEVWNPELTEAERATVRAVIEVGERLQRHWADIARGIVDNITL